LKAILSVCDLNHKQGSKETLAENQTLETLSQIVLHQLGKNYSMSPAD